MTASSTSRETRSRWCAFNETIASWLVAAVTIGIMACGGGKDAPTSPSSANVAGTYALLEIDQASLPVEIFNGRASDATTGKVYDEFIVRIKDGALELDANGRYRTRFGYTLTLDGVPEDRTLTAQGTYEVKGKEIILTHENGVDKGGGSIEGGQITMEMTLVRNTPNKSYVFRK
jgi:hypothetical protein